MGDTVVNLELFKKHVRSDDFADDDIYMLHLIKAATESVTIAVNRTESEIREMGGGTFPPSLQQAVMVLAAHWYNQRESVSTTQMHEVPDTLQSLLRPYRKLVNDTPV